jgi:magnesium transporter
VSDRGIEEPVAKVRELLLARHPEELRAFLTSFHPSDLADLLEELEEDERGVVLRALSHSPALAAEALAEMEWEEHPEDALASLEPHHIASLVRQLSDDDAADIIGELDPGDQARVLAALTSADARDIRDLLRYDEESAGGLMTTDLVAVDDRLSASEAIDAIRRQGHDSGEFYNVFVIDAERRLTGLLPLHVLVTAAPGARVSELAEPVIATVVPEMDQEEVGRILSRYNLVAVPVVDRNNRLLGRITFDDVIDVFEAETTEDILKFGGVSQEEELRGGWEDAVRSRLPWLAINLVTAFAAASVVVIFEGTIHALPILAAWMPVIAGMGGNAGTQALAVTVRRLALSPESSGRRWEVIGKELLVGLANGLAMGIVAALVAVVMGQTPMLGAVVMAAMWMNLVVAGFAGAFVPIILESLGVDPAVASSIFVTTFTDLVGFFLLLGLATQLLL